MTARRSRHPSEPTREPDVLLPEEWRNHWDSAPHSPQLALRFAVLEAALRDLVKARGTTGHHATAVVADVLAWVADPDERWPFAFVPLCEVLGIDPDRLRARVAGRG